MIVNKHLVAALCALAVVVPAALPGSAAAAEQVGWEFGVLLDDKEIGYHNFIVTTDGQRQTMETEASFDVKFLFVTAFRYRHQNTETWSDGCLASIDATTDSNGKRLAVEGRRDDDRFALTGQAGETTLTECVQTFAYWNPAILESDRLLNSQTGEYEDVSVSFEDYDEVRVGDRLVDAMRYRLSARAGHITLWYSTLDRRWLALEAPARGGRTIRYEPVSIPEAATFQQQFARSS